MKERIIKLIATIKSGIYDPEGTHSEYDELLEEFILNYDEKLLDLMKELIELDKEFWYT